MIDQVTKPALHDFTPLKACRSRQIGHYFYAWRTTPNSYYSSAQKGMPGNLGSQIGKTSGKQRKEEPKLRAKFTRNELVWTILCRGVGKFIDRLQGSDKNVSKQIKRSWRNGNVKVNGVNLTISPRLIAMATSMELEGIKFTRDKGVTRKEVKACCEKEENPTKIAYGYLRSALSAPWNEVVSFIMKLLTLEGK